MQKDIIHVVVTFSIIALTGVGGTFAYARQQTNLEAIAKAEEARVLSEINASVAVVEAPATVEGAEVLLETALEAEPVIPVPEPVVVPAAPAVPTRNEPTAAELQALADKEAARVRAATLAAELEKQRQLQKIADAKAAQVAAEELAAQVAAKEAAAALAAERALAKEKSRRSRAS